MTPFLDPFLGVLDSWGILYGLFPTHLEQAEMGVQNRGQKWPILSTLFKYNFANCQFYQKQHQIDPLDDPKMDPILDPSDSMDSS